MRPKQLQSQLRHKLSKCYFTDMSVANPLVMLNEQSFDFLRSLSRQRLWAISDWIKILSNAADELSGRRPGTAMYTLQQNRPVMPPPTYPQAIPAASHPLGDDFMAELQAIVADNRSKRALGTG